MALKVFWTDRAKSHLRDILDFIAFDNPDAARKLARTVLARVGRLSRYPNSGRPLPELEGAPFREKVIPPCRVIYQVREKAVLILVVLRTERHFQPGFLEP
jgi:plasmid stabilization system protein ParE